MTSRTVLPSATDVRAAAARFGDAVIRTPLILSPALSAAVGGEVWIKVESLQNGGSFKIRGALNALLSLSDEVRARGVVASSAGNHGLGVAIAAERLGVRATVFVPSTAPAVKRAKITSHGATIDTTQPNYDAAERAARAFATAHGATFVSPCAGLTLLAGAGTIAIEVLDERPSLGTIVVPVGGGGLVGGIGGYLREVAPAVRILGAQSILTNAMALALKSGLPTDIPDVPTLADGLAGLVDAEMLAQGQAALDGIATVEEREIAEAIGWAKREHDLTLEGAGAVGIAALLTGSLRPVDYPVVVIASGANIDPAKLRAIIG